MIDVTSELRIGDLLRLPEVPGHSPIFCCKVVVITLKELWFKMVLTTNIRGLQCLLEPWHSVLSPTPKGAGYDKYRQPPLSSCQSLCTKLGSMLGQPASALAPESRCHSWSWQIWCPDHMTRRQRTRISDLWHMHENYASIQKHMFRLCSSHTSYICSNSAADVWLKNIILPRSSENSQNFSLLRSKRDTLVRDEYLVSGSSCQCLHV